MRQIGNAVLAYEPVMRELDALCEIFDEIIWLGCNDNRAGRILSEIQNPKIKPIVMPSVHNRLFNVFFVALAYPVFIFSILQHLHRATYIQSRGPSHPAFISILISLFDKKRTYWHKYAGDWFKKSVPFTYRIQRSVLTKAARDNVFVTISGKYHIENNHIAGFENPCLTTDERGIAIRLAKQKDFSGNLTLVFVGSIVSNKGVTQLITALASKDLNSKIQKVYLAGSGPLQNIIKQQASSINRNVIVTGQLTRDQLAELYAESHIIILPTESEGFPKVIAEGTAYGCIPVVTNISAIPQYIAHGDNGFLLNSNSPQHIVDVLNNICSLDIQTLSAISSAATLMSQDFTYSHYISRLEKMLSVPS
jgi:Glycosyltransferase